MNKATKAVLILLKIDKNLLLVDGSIRNALLCVKNILAQDVDW